ncbi:transmembrane emp24 domain-containing protein p24delta9-like [Punica granatum]|uniref:GOLD domain-containing protein n=2 Tax=Punica granatum TaxID=22663 RepID=A0A218WU66_PUNGR|nr:transmembrane emp24 domain-containing protein p24delta9-like [Punica granatum]OWM75920.1 hypothetical protein CDL15_Pgr009564 [Punica granatum]PKI36795.1 hypothetical protein CRG98_042744 [Punica granatum]
MIRFRIPLLLILGTLFRVSESLRFELKSGGTRCISEDIGINSMTVGKYHIINPNEGHPMPESHKVTVRLISSHGNTYHYADSVDAGQFAFTTGDKGEHSACFWGHQHDPPVTMTIEIDWKTGVTTKEWPSVAKKGQVDVMELELKKLQETISAIHYEMFYLRDREEEMQELNRSTNSKMAWMSFLSLAVCLSVAGLQLWHLKTFFEKKKII